MSFNKENEPISFAHGDFVSEMASSKAMWQPALSTMNVILAVLVLIAEGCGEQESARDTSAPGGDAQPASGGNEAPPSASDAQTPQAPTPPVMPGKPAARCDAPPEPLAHEGAAGERESCGISDGTKAGVDVAECEDRTLTNSGLGYCVRAHEACQKPSAGCFAVITFNMGPKGLSQTIGNRTRRPDLFGRFVAVGGGTSANTAQMIELPGALRKEFPGIDAKRIYVLGNSAGNGAISNMLKDPAAHTQYAAATVIAGGIRVPDSYRGSKNLHVLFANGKKDVEEPPGLRDIAERNGCSDALVATWNSAASNDAYVRGDCSDIVERITFANCQFGQVLAYRFKDEGHEARYARHFDPEVRPMRMGFDFYMGRTLDGGLLGDGSACWK
ncbi:MAG: hypothetical protein SF187_16985 [Deltaproteobacteria bacterium]|nr:hypothetical protein [Deltaproteobacteria bacterium]